MAKKFEIHLAQVESWIARQNNMEDIFIPYNEIIKSPTLYSEKVNGFLRQDLNTETMSAAVEKTLYRHRTTNQ
jgi:hypothetical protein